MRQPMKKSQQPLRQVVGSQVGNNPPSENGKNPPSLPLLLPTHEPASRSQVALLQVAHCTPLVPHCASLVPPSNRPMQVLPEQQPSQFDGLHWFEVPTQRPAMHIWP